MNALKSRYEETTYQSPYRERERYGFSVPAEDEREQLWRRLEADPDSLRLYDYRTDAEEYRRVGNAFGYEKAPARSRNGARPATRGAKRSKLSLKIKGLIAVYAAIVTTVITLVIINVVS